MAADESISRRASSFGAEAAAYATHRPDYPVDAVRWVLDPVSAGGPPRVLDLGAGTGKLTAVIAGTGAGVTAVEPDGAMRAELVRALPGVRALAGSAEQIPLADGSVDAVLVGQAYHWFDLERALPEIGRVLRPGGVLGLLWNTEDQADWLAGFKAIYQPAEDRLAARKGLELHLGPFGEHEQEWFRHSQPRTAESMVETVSTYSAVLVMAEPERARTRAELLAYLRARPETSGEFDLPLRTLAVRTPRV
ncbi:class I SAM-dependent methyltransferase [Kutzneria viridogrisea]|uniref:Type 11 methyltransferase n=2 Tax=Kutzneria TaxID=43356 RepID=W5VZ73_9PSEU|nr:class I SAM-dependent methyltransferase [Kutzneria albida]AHH93755.1 type 11 methyltransferase [Kutzneria albida DSM 43870]MBA8931241.1 SAM-dependent methyltransferase [Kutzneria viridogrisea]